MATLHVIEMSKLEMSSWSGFDNKPSSGKIINTSEVPKLDTVAQRKDTEWIISVVFAADLQID